MQLERQSFMKNISLDHLNFAFFQYRIFVIDRVIMQSLVLRGTNTISNIFQPILGGVEKIYIDGRSLRKRNLSKKINIS